MRNYTPAQVSEITGIPPSTLRYYARRFAAYLSSQTGRKQRLYTEQDIAVFVRIKDLADSNVPLDQIGPRLQVESKDESAPLDSTLALNPSIKTELDLIRAAAQESTRHLAADLDQLRAQVQQQADQLAAFNQWAALPWWKRFLTAPPRPPAPPHERG